MNAKIALDLKQSIYTLNKGEWYFVFSSESNLRKFNEQFDSYITHETLKLRNKYSFLNIDFRNFLIVSLYKRFEKRGFYIKYNGIELKENTLFISSFVDDDSIHF